MIVVLKWLPDNGVPETLVWTGVTEAEYRYLLATWVSASPSDVLIVPTQASPDGPIRDRLFRAGRIISILPGEPPA